MTTRAEFLAQIRSEMRRTRGLFSAAPVPRPARPREAAELIQRELIERWPETLERFRREFERVGGVLHRVPAAGDVAAVVTAIARDHAASRVVTWHGAGVGPAIQGALEAQGLQVTGPPPVSYDPERHRSASAGASGGAGRGPGQPPARDSEDQDRATRLRLQAAAAAAELGVTGVDLAIAETGTLVLRTGSGRPRATSLLPPTHVAVFGPGALVESLEQLGVFLEAWHVDDGDWGAAINLITGPSRTADIELTLTRGVHGPRDVHAVVVEGGLDG